MHQTRKRGKLKEMSKFSLIALAAMLLGSMVLVGCGSKDEGEGDMTPPKGAGTASPVGAAPGGTTTGGGGAPSSATPSTQ